jgi:hypothetical protein
MKKGLIIFGIIAWVIIIVFIIIFLVFRVNAVSFVASNFFGSSVLVKEEMISIQNIDSIIIQGDRKGIEIVAADSEQARVSQYGSSGTPAEELFTITESNGCLTINSKNDLEPLNYLIPRFSRELIIVELPAFWTGDMAVDSSSGGIKTKSYFKWEDVRLNSSSGGINLEQGLSADNLNVSASSGGIRSGGELTVDSEIMIVGSSGGVRLTMPVKADVININSTSGAINTNDINAATLILSNTSGGITLEEVKTNDFNIKNISGGITAAGISGAGDISNSSGGIRVKLVEPVGKVDLSTSSGSINITVDESLAFSFNGETSSGGIKANFPLQLSGNNNASAIIGNDPAASITAKASSGGITINQ